MLEVADEATLSYSRVAPDEHDTAGAIDSTVESLDQRPERLLAAN
jgi:hypothetical protein